MKSKIAFISVLFFIFSIFTIVSCSKVEKEPFKIAIVTWVGYGPFYIAEEKGYYQEEGIGVEIVRIEEEGARKSAFVSGKIHGAVNTVDTLASSVPRGVPGRVIFKIDESFGGDGIVAKNDITEINQLKGRTVAYPQGLPSHFFLLYLLDKAGMTTSDIISRNMEAGDAGAAFVAGKVDAAVTWEPWLSQAAETKHGHVLVTSKEAPGLVVDIFMITPTIAKNRTNDVRKLMRAWFKALDFVKQNPDEAYRIMAKHLNLTAEDVAGLVNVIKYADYEDNLRYFGLKEEESVFAEVFNSAGRIWKRERAIDQPATAEEVVLISFLKNLYK